MLIDTNGYSTRFRPWRPEDGRIFNSTFSFDSETTLIDDDRPWITPAYVLGAAFDGQRGVFVQRRHVEQFFRDHEGVPFIAHNATFDLAVVDLVAPELDIYRCVDAGLVWDTQLLHQLYILGTEGHAATGKGQATLETAIKRHLGFDVPKDVMAADGSLVRTSYARWLNHPPQEIEQVYLEYLGIDALVTFHLKKKLDQKLADMLVNANDAFGFVSESWLSEQAATFGWQTHHIQLKAAVVLKQITANGLHVDLARREALAEQLREVADEKRELLRSFGYLPGQAGSDKALQEILKQLEREHSGNFPRTATGKYESSAEALENLRGIEPFVDTLLEFRAVEKLLSTYLGKMSKAVLHPSFGVLKTSGRTSSFGEINAQNLPRDDRVRSCFAASPGHAILSADYAAVEMATLAQALTKQFGLHSHLADILNAGQDPHRLVAAMVLNKPEDSITDAKRQKAKAINFGKPGGMGNRTLRRYARASYGVELSVEEAEQWSESWFKLFPEMRTFLYAYDDLGRETAGYFGLTPHAYFSHTGRRSFLDHPDNLNREHQPHAILGSMCLKVLREPEPIRGTGAPYGDEERDFFWSRAQSRIDDFPKKNRAAFRNQLASYDTCRAAMNLAGRGTVITLTGRLRANATYAARHNNIFQGLAADGAKIALWLLWRAGYRIVNFVHDEALVELPQGCNYREEAERVRELMIQGMKTVVPDIRIDVAYAVSERWYKSAKAVFDNEGKLTLWQPRPTD